MTKNKTSFLIPWGILETSVHLYKKQILNREQYPPKEVPSEFNKTALQDKVCGDALNHKVKACNLFQTWVTLWNNQLLSEAHIAMKNSKSAQSKIANTSADQLSP